MKRLSLVLPILALIACSKDVKLEDDPQTNQFSFAIYESDSLYLEGNSSFKVYQDLRINFNTDGGTQVVAYLDSNSHIYEILSSGDREPLGGGVYILHNVHNTERIDTLRIENDSILTGRINNHKAFSILSRLM